MKLHVHRSPRVQDLVDDLQRQLSKHWPEDPFAPLPILVGSRGMGRWLRHELATRWRSAARLDFLFPRNAFDAAAAWLLEDPSGEGAPDAIFWQVERARDAWSGATLVARVLRVLRARCDDPSFAAIRRYLAHAAPTPLDGERPVDRREAAFASEVAAVVERLHYDRPDDALAWSRAPAEAPEAHRWLAEVLATLEAESGVREGVGPSPSARLDALRRAAIAPRTRTLHVFGLSTLRPGDKLRIAWLARWFEVRLYLLVPTRAWWGESATVRERKRALRKKLAQETLTQLDVAELRDVFGQNSLLAANGGPSRDLQLWLEELPEQYHDESTTGEREAALVDGVGAESPDDPSDEAPSVLRRLQAWLDVAGDDPGRGAPLWPARTEARARASLEIHACHGALRQCEALRDELLRRFARDETLEPRHVLVMTPDVATYAPLVAAVFGRSTVGRSTLGGTTSGERTPSDAEPRDGATGPESPAIPAIPVHIADLGLRATNTVAEALMRVLALTDARVTATALLELLALWPVRDRFGIAETELPEVRELVVGAGLRWGWNAEDRRGHAQPPLAQNTVAFGLERLALGVLMPDDDPLDLLAATDACDPAVPFEVATRDRAVLVGKLAAFCQTVLAVRDALSAAGSPTDWRTRLLAAVDALTLTHDETAWLRVQLVEALEEHLPSGFDDALTLDRTAIASLLAGAFELPARGDRPVTGAVTVCAMEPMRSVPFRVIAMLGLDDGAFPRAATLPAWDPFATPRLGEHDRRTLDRHLFLESLLCAEDALLLFGTGFEPKRGTDAPMAVVASELAELLADGAGLAPEEARALGWPVRRHPLQPWSARAFTPGPDAAEDRLPFDPVAFAARRALASGATRPAGLGATAPDAVWPKEARPPTSITAERLARALENGPRELLEQRLGLHLERKDDEVPDREPLELDELDRWSVRKRILDVLLDEDAADSAGAESVEDHEGEPAASDDEASTNANRIARLGDRLRAEGTLPLHAGAGAALAEAEAEARTTLARVTELGGQREAARDFVTSVDGLVVSAHAHDVRGEIDAQGQPTGDVFLVWAVPSAEPNGRMKLLAWITLLVARAQGARVSRAVCMGHGNGEESEFTLEASTVRDSGAAAETLRRLVALWRSARSAPLPLFPRVTAKAGNRVANVGTPLSRERAEDILDECASEWEGSKGRPGDRDDPWIAAVYPGLGLEDLDAERVVQVALDLWGPAFRGVSQHAADAKRDADGEEESP